MYVKHNYKYTLLFETYLNVRSKNTRDVIKHLLVAPTILAPYMPHYMNRIGEPKTNGI